jgi:hypothetical protein
MADQGLEGSQPVDLSKHPSGIVPTLQWVSLNWMFSDWLRVDRNCKHEKMSKCAVRCVFWSIQTSDIWEFELWCVMWVCVLISKL